MLNLGHRLLSVGRNEESLELFERAIAESEASGLDLRRGAMNRNNACEALFALGRWDEAIAQADTVRSRIEFRFASRMAGIIRARVATARGEDDLARSLLSWVEADGQGLGEPHMIAHQRMVVAEGAVWDGRYDGRTRALAVPWTALSRGVRGPAARRSRAGRRRPASGGARALRRCNAGRAARRGSSGSADRRCRRRGGIGASRAPALDDLTAREREILTMVVSGSSNRDIATALFISPKTVSVHVSALLRRLGVSGSADRSAAMQAGELGAPPYGSTR
jgi:DNA-binding CsgD family transcriptional regulator